MRGDSANREVVARCLQRGAHAIAALAHRGVRQTDGVEVILVALDAGAIDLNLDDVGIDPVDRSA